MEDTKFNFDEIDKKEWIQLGVYYEIDDTNKKWLFYGSKEGVNKFIDALISYTNLPKNKDISEHEHYGPYQYFKVITWNEPIINEQGILGSITDISRIAKIILTKIKSAKVNDEIIIDNDYASNNVYKLVIKIMKDDFNPSSLDIQSI